MDWLPYEHLLDHIYALAVERMSDEAREHWDEWLWSDPKREARILSELGLFRR